MSFAKAVDLLRLAMMATSRQGVCLSDVEAEFGGVRRTAQRMIAALEEAFPATEHYVGDDCRHYWRLPSRAVAPLLTPSAEELVSLRSAISELERVDMNGEAIQLRSLERKVRALIPSDRTLRLATDEEALLEAMGFAARPGPRPSMNEAVDLAISEAIKGPFELKIQYQGRRDAKPRWRTIEPRHGRARMQGPQCLQGPRFQGDEGRRMPYEGRDDRRPRLIQAPVRQVFCPLRPAGPTCSKSGLLLMTDISAFGGFGLGLRRDHYRDFLAGDVAVDFVEVISENFMVDGGRPLRVLEQVRAKLPVILHGVSLSVGSAHGLDGDHLARLKALADRIEPLWVSDHLCWNRTSAHNSHDLLPLPLTSATMDVVCANIARAQEMLGQAMLFENPSSYLTFPEDEMTEWEFLAEMSRRTGCYLLLDINNIYVSACNHGFDPATYLSGIPAGRVRQVHLAGHTPGAIVIDTHDRPVCDAVWELYESAIGRLGDVAVMIERDDAIPTLADLLTELDRARTIAATPRTGTAI